MTLPQSDIDAEAGRPAAAIVWLLYILSIPSAGALVIVGLIVAYASRSQASGWPRTHFDAQIRLFWVAFWWAVGLAILTGIGVVLSLIIIGIPLLWLAAVAGFIVMVWFTVVSVLGLIAVAQGRPTR